MSEELPKNKPMGLYDIINLDVHQNFFPKRKKEISNIISLKEDLNMDKTLSGNSNSSNNSNVSNASRSTAASKTASSNKVEIQLKKYFEPSYKSDHLNKREPTEDEILAAFKFYD